MWSWSPQGKQKFMVFHQMQVLFFSNFCLSISPVETNRWMWSLPGSQLQVSILGIGSLAFLPFCINLVGLLLPHIVRASLLPRIHHVHSALLTFFTVLGLLLSVFPLHITEIMTIEFSQYLPSLQEIIYCLGSPLVGLDHGLGPTPVHPKPSLINTSREIRSIESLF